MRGDGVRREDERAWGRRVVAAAADALVARQVGGDGASAGGWSNAGRDEPSIASTAQALRVLRAAQRPYDAWAAGQAFLRRAVSDLDGSSLGVERHVRYWNHAVIGLVLPGTTPLDEPRARAAQAAAITICLHRIVDLALPTGGWSAPDDARLSPTKTGRTLVAIADARRNGWLEGPIAEQVSEAAGRGADRLLALQRADGSWPTNLAGRDGPPSPAATAHAAIALSRAARQDLTPTRRAFAAVRRARDWLLVHAATWTTAAERDDWIANRTWIHPTYALGLRMCLDDGASVLDRRLAPALRLLRTDYRGPRDGGGWRERGGRIGGQVTVNATYNAVMALASVQRAWARTDAFDVLETLGALAPGSGATVSIRLGPNYTVDAVAGESAVHGPVIMPSTWRLLAIFAGYEDSASQRGIATHVLAQELGCSTDASARAAVSRANADLRRWLEEIGAGSVAIARHGFAYRLGLPVALADGVDLSALR